MNITTDLQSSAYRMALREFFGVQPVEADILVSLYVAAGAFVTAAVLAADARRQGGKTTTGAIAQRISQVRQAMNSEAIDSAVNQGYRLTDIGLAECRAALWMMGEELRRAS